MGNPVLYYILQFLRVCDKRVRPCQVSAVRSVIARKVARVKAQADRVPRGMFLSGEKCN